MNFDRETHLLPLLLIGQPAGVKIAAAERTSFEFPKERGKKVDT